MIDGHSNPIKDGAGGLSVEPQTLINFQTQSYLIKAFKK